MRFVLLSGAKHTFDLFCAMQYQNYVVFLFCWFFSICVVLTFFAVFALKAMFRMWRFVLGERNQIQDEEMNCLLPARYMILVHLSF